MMNVPKKPRTTTDRPSPPRWPVVRTKQDLSAAELRYLTLLAKQFLSRAAVERRKSTEIRDHLAWLDWNR
jgi:hypothetical protein